MSLPDARELALHASPAGRPQPLAFHNRTLWVGCWDTAHLYAMDVATWTVIDEVAAPGIPYGLASFDGALRVVVSIGEADDRFLYRFVPGQGFDPTSKIECPEFTGSHLTSDGKLLYLTQQANQRILALDAGAAVIRTIALPTRCAGVSSVAGTFYLISADDEWDELHLATLDIGLDHPGVELVARLVPESRGLAFDGAAWWTSRRELGEVAAFSVT